MSGSAITLPLPLPVDVDLSGMEHMPLFDERLMRSRAWLRAKNWRGDGPGLGFCLINLWARAFREVPAGSIEDDEDVLAEAAGCDIAHWRALKEKALLGWRLIDGRWHNRVVSEIAFGLWRARLAKRHENAVNSWRMMCKRATDKGVEPPDPPGPFDAWMVHAHPATATYLDALSTAREAHNGTAASSRAANIGECALNIPPKRSEAKLNPPFIPPAADGGAAARATQSGLGSRGKAGRLWYAKELARLKNEFGPMALAMQSNLQTRSASGEFGLVQTFKGAWLDGRAGAIVMPTKRRADALRADHGVWMAFHWPALTVRHATVDELRAFTAERAPR